MTVSRYIYVCHDLTDCTSSIGQKDNAAVVASPSDGRYKPHNRILPRLGAYLNE